MCLTSIISWHLDIMDQSQCWVFFLVNDVMESEGCAQRMTLTRNLSSFDKCYYFGLCKSLVGVKVRFIGIQKVHIYCYCIILKLRSVFPLLFPQCTCKQLTFHHVLWKQRPKSNQNIPNHCTTWTFANFLHAWIKFYQSNSILPHKTSLHHNNFDFLWEEQL